MRSEIDVHTNTPPPATSADRVLVVDDEAVIRTLARMMLERSGFAVDEAGTAASAVARVQGSPSSFDVVVLDYTLPDRRGTDVIPELRRVAPHVRIVLTSGRLEEDMPGHGADGYLGKPFSKDQLVAAIRAALTSAPK